jgi:uncharacterized membrane protein
MNPAQVHLALNHFPIIGLLIVLIFYSYGLFSKSEVIQRFSLIVMVFLALVSLPVFFSGEGAEEIIEETTSVSHDLIHEHEEAGEVAFFVMEALGILAILGLVLISRKKFANSLKYIILIVGLVTFVLMGRAGSLGGKIMHPELNMVFPDDD